MQPKSIVLEPDYYAQGEGSSLVLAITDFCDFVSEITTEITGRPYRTMKSDIWPAIRLKSHDHIRDVPNWTAARVRNLTIGSSYKESDILKIEELQKFESLKRLTVMSMKIEGLHNLKKLSNLRDFRVEATLREQIPDEVMKNLKELHITVGKGLSDEPIAPNLVAATMARANFRNFSFRGMRSLKTLTLVNINTLRNLEPLKELVNLQRLTLHSVENIEYLEGLEYLKNLKILEIELCKDLKSLHGVSGLKKIFRIDAMNCKKLKRFDFGNYPMNKILINLSGVPNFEFQAEKYPANLEIRHFDGKDWRML